MKVRCSAAMQRPCGAVRSAVHLLLLLVTGVLRITSCQILVARCPSGDPLDTPNHYCECKQKDYGHSSKTIFIKCDFDFREDVLLNKELFPFRNSSLVSAYVRIVNATSVNVTGQFLKEWLQAPSAALDIWRGGNVTLEPVPELDNLDTFSSYRTFVGIGIVSCDIGEIPRMFLRDRTRGGFRIKTSRVGILRAGLLHNINEMRYLVLEDSVVETVEGSVATEGYVTLSQRNVHSWNGLILSNTTIQTVGTGAFNLTHQSDMESVEVKNCHLGTLGTGAFTVVGDIAVTITANYFHKLEKEAFKVSVTGDVKFDENIIDTWESDALEGIMCHNRTTIERNTVHVDTPQDVALNDTTTPFHTSCGNPQMFLVVSPAQPLVLKVSTSATWALAALLILLVVSLAATHLWHTKSAVTRYYAGGGRFPILLNGRKLSQENLPNSADLPHSPEEGKSNPGYNNTDSSVSPDTHSLNIPTN